MRKPSRPFSGPKRSSARAGDGVSFWGSGRIDPGAGRGDAGESGSVPDSIGAAFSGSATGFSGVDPLVEAEAGAVDEFAGGEPDRPDALRDEAVGACPVHMNGGE